MAEEQKKYIEFLKFCLNSEAEIPACVSVIDWHRLLNFAKEQAVTGIYWLGIQKLGGVKHNKPTDDDVMEWMVAVTAIRKRNQIVNEKTAWVSKNFTKEGFDNCILKGQANALYYPSPDMRTPGDIDIWVRSKDFPLHPSGKAMDREVRAVIAYCRQFLPKAKACYHHIDFLNAGDVSVEVHYRPSWLNNPIHNRRLQRWFQEHAVDGCISHSRSQDFPVPTSEFDIVFQLCHILNHLLHEGIGLKQICDYYYLLKSKPLREEQTYRTTVTLLAGLGLLPIARAVMWVLQEVSDIDEDQMIVEPDVRLGHVLMTEIMDGGNFGRFDFRLMSGAYSSSVKSNLQRTVRDLRLMRFFPSECMWEPWFRIRHWWWRRTH